LRLLSLWFRSDPGQFARLHHRGRFRQRALHAINREHPSENPNTGKNVALSVIAMLRKMHAPSSGSDRIIAANLRVVSRLIVPGL